jgi:hypothetical protein
MLLLVCYTAGPSVIVGDPAMPAEAKEASSAHSRAIGEIEDYIPAPTWGPTKQRWRGCATKSDAPSGYHAIGGIPLDEIGATGPAASAEAAQSYCDVSLSGRA